MYIIINLAKNRKAVYIIIMLKRLNKSHTIQPRKKKNQIKQVTNLVTSLRKKDLYALRYDSSSQYITASYRLRLLP